MSDTKYPHITVQLTGNNGNAFAIMGAVKKALLADGIDDDEITEYMSESMDGDYDNLLQVAMRWVDVR